MIDGVRDWCLLNQFFLLRIYFFIFHMDFTSFSIFDATDIFTPYNNVNDRFKERSLEKGWGNKRTRSYCSRKYYKHWAPTIGQLRLVMLKITVFAFGLRFFLFWWIGILVRMWVFCFSLLVSILNFLFYFWNLGHWFVSIGSLLRRLYRFPVQLCGSCSRGWKSTVLWFGFEFWITPMGQA